MTKQVDVTHYDFDKYLCIERWASYYHQIAECVALSPKNVLLVGVGDGIVVSVLERLLPPDAKVETLDFDADLNPDFCGSVADIDKLVRKNFDVIICCQVLEHLPFNLFEGIILQMSKKAKHLIISLPYRSFRLKIAAVFYKYKEKCLFLRIPTFWQKFDINKQGRGEHYWEIGCRGTMLKQVKTILQKHGNLRKSYAVVHNLYHHFFVLTTNN